MRRERLDTTMDRLKTHVATYYPYDYEDPETDAKEVAVIFNNPYNLNTTMGEIESLEPNVVVLQKDIESPKQKDLFIIDEVTYYVTEVMPDNTGLCVLNLSKDSPDDESET